MAIHALPDSLYMRFHYHDAETKLYYDLKLLTDSYVYQYNAIYTEPSAFLNSLKTQQNEVPFQTDKFALVQGLSGYMVKIEIPNPEILDPYKTVIKAEIEIKPYVWSTPPIAMPSTINVYTTNKINEIKEQLYNSSNSAVTGTYRIDPQNTENNRYIFDITDFYSRLTNTPSIVGNETKILLALPNLVSSYDQMVIKDIPVLRVYYATYKN